MHALIKKRGFTLLETIIYIALFGLIFTGIFSSIYPILTSADRLTNLLLVENEKEFLLTKIEYILNDSLTTTNAQITEPLAGATSSQLIIKNSTLEKYRLVIGDTNCQIPRICNGKQIILTKDSGSPLPLNNNRIILTNLIIYRSPAQPSEFLNYVDITFTTNNELVGPIRYYLHF